MHDRGSRRADETTEGSTLAKGFDQQQPTFVAAISDAGKACLVVRWSIPWPVTHRVSRCSDLFAAHPAHDVRVFRRVSRGRR